MFAVELAPPELDEVRALFPDVEPVLLYDRWAGRDTICVWEVNKVRTYGFPGEPADERWRGVMGLTSRERRIAIWDMLPPETLAEINEKWDASREWDRGTMLGYAAILREPPPKVSWWERILG